MKKWASIAVLFFIALVGIAAPAAAYSQRTTYPGASAVTFKDGSCQGYGASETDFVHTVQMSPLANTCDFIRVRANYKNGAWVGYSNWKSGLNYLQFVPPSGSTVNFGQHGIDSYR
ncbi:hypothetical protein [Demequina sp.]|uniref:hypothetical protein n=1 Tax=Demequina sp. TaxID=2050685 RepID=UPI003D0A4143